MTENSVGEAAKFEQVEVEPAVFLENKRVNGRVTFGGDNEGETHDGYRPSCV